MGSVVPVSSIESLNYLRPIISFSSIAEARRHPAKHIVSLVANRSKYLHTDWGDNQHVRKNVFIELPHQGLLSPQSVHPLLISLQLANGRTMPQIHLGVYLTSGHETVNAVRWALEVSRRNIGTNEYH